MLLEEVKEALLFITVNIRLLQLWLKEFVFAEQNYQYKI